MRSKFTEENRQQNMEEDIEKIKRNFFPNEKNEHYSIFGDPKMHLLPLSYCLMLHQL